jgi:hypothetical protein
METIYIIILSILSVGMLLLATLLIQKERTIRKMHQISVEEKVTIEALKEENEVLNMEIEFIKKIYRTKLLKLGEASRNLVEVE